MGYQLVPKDWNRLLSLLHPHIVDLQKKEMVLSEKQEDRQAGCILEGMVYLCAENELFERSILHFFRPGEYFSASMLPTLGNGISYMITKQPTKIAYFNRDSLLHFCLQNPQESELLTRIIGTQLEQNSLTQNYILHQRSIRSKLLYFFKKESEIQGGNIITMPIPFSDLADHLVIDRTAMMKELGKMKKDGLISGSNHVLTIH